MEATLIVLIVFLVFALSGLPAWGYGPADGYYTLGAGLLLLIAALAFALGWRHGPAARRRDL